MDSSIGQSDMSDQEVIGKSRWSVKLTTFQGDGDDDKGDDDDDDDDDGDGDKDDGSDDGDGEREDSLTLLVRVSMRPLVLRADVVLKQTLLILLVRLE